MIANDTHTQQINVDDLAKEKVQEIEKLLDDTSECLRSELVNAWFSVLKQIITAADLHRTSDKSCNNEVIDTKPDTDESIYADYADDNEQFNAIDLTEQFATNSVKWTIRVKAFKVVHRLMGLLEKIDSNQTLFNSIILKHLPDLVRLSFVAATSPFDDLKIQGFFMFKYLIERFASTEEKEFPGHSILEQYKTQVLSALKPAFNSDAPPYITAIASQVCCLWLCHGLEQDPTDLKRTYQLMLLSIEKLNNQSVNQNSKLYTESELEQERLDILGSWSQLYIKTSIDTDSISANLSELVKPQIEILMKKCWEALRDYALLIMPAPRTIGTLHDNEHVYTREVALKLFESVWPKLILASTIWLCKNDSIPKRTEDKMDKSKYLKFICGIILKEFYRCSSNNSCNESTSLALESVQTLISNQETRLQFFENLTVVREFYVAIYRIYVISSIAHDHVILKNLLHLIFEITTEKLSKVPESVRHGFTCLMNSVDKHLQILKNPDDLDRPIEEVKLHLTIEIYNLKTLIKFASDQVTASDDLHRSITRILRELILLEQNLSNQQINFFDHLKDIYNTSNQTLISCLFDAEADLVTNLIKSLNNDGCQDKGKKMQILGTLDLHLKSLRSNIGSNLDLMNAYVRIFINTGILDTTFKEEGSNLGNRKVELVALAVKYINDLYLLDSQKFVKMVDPEILEVYESAKAFLQQLRSKNEAKRQTNKKVTAINPDRSAKVTPKIVLKADFSNFYTKKS